MMEFLLRVCQAWEINVDNVACCLHHEPIIGVHFASGKLTHYNKGVRISFLWVYNGEGGLEKISE